MKKTSEERSKRAKEIARTLRREVRRYADPIVDTIERNTSSPFLVLVATVLSLRTRDVTTAVAARRLFKHARTPQTMMKLSQKTIARCIYPVGMYPTKAKWLRALSRILVDEYGGTVPRTQAQLMALPGVGRKVANLVLGLSYVVPAICVDTHVHRISHRLGLTRTRTPEETEYALERVLPKRLWISWNTLLVTWGQNICTPLAPRCSQCILQTKGLCPQVGVRVSR